MAKAETLTLQQLLEQQAQLQALIEKTQAEQLEAAFTQLDALISEHGITSDMLAHRYRIKTANPVKRTLKADPDYKPLYTHPKNPALTWSGRGKPAAWVREAQSQGFTLEEMKRKD